MLMRLKTNPHVLSSFQIVLTLNLRPKLQSKLTYIIRPNLFEHPLLFENMSNHPIILRHSCRTIMPSRSKVTKNDKHDLPSPIHGNFNADRLHCCSLWEPVTVCLEHYLQYLLFLVVSSSVDLW